MAWDKVNFNPARQMAVINMLQPQSHWEDSEQRNKHLAEEESRRNQVKNSTRFVNPRNVTTRRSPHFPVHQLG